MLIVYKENVYLTDLVKHFTVFDYKAEGHCAVGLYYSDGSTKNLGPFKGKSDSIRRVIIQAMIDRPKGALDLDQYSTMEEK